MTTEEKIDHVYEFCIRMEPVVEDVKNLKQWKNGNGSAIPGAQFQLRLMWAAFVAVGAAIWHKFTKS